MPPRRAHDPELELPPRDRLDDRLRVRHRERDGHARADAVELTEEERQQRLARPGRRAQLEPPAKVAVRLRRRLVEQLLLEREQLLRPAVEPPAGLCRLDAPAGAVEELRAEPLLERADLEADRRLGDPEPRRRL